MSAIKTLIPIEGGNYKPTGFATQDEQVRIKNKTFNSLCSQKTIVFERYIEAYNSEFHINLIILYRTPLMIDKEE